VVRLYDAGTTVRESEVLRGRLEPPAVAISPADASRLGIGDGEAVEVSWDGRTRRLNARVRESVPPGLVIVPRSVDGGVDGALPVNVRRAG
jgi:anaerobic selenocysteine-containing dehydrogenase